ncbi:hypothetical protein EHZ86_14800 [Aeromonas australiensis]|uniref:hypothetical protein n=1 Tax=Aeromonas australiensis TaxID=1114880 RepID=UPI001F283404|nr:hypothetical protein [Aeromonas australiensis]MCF3098515.1 hypothetical protein [Aeromonas australiensis]
MRSVVVMLLGLLALPLWATPTVVSTVPVLHALNLSLLADTGILARYLPPARLPLNRIPGWLNKVDVATLGQADALLTMESLQPELAIYPLLRQRQIRIVPIDVANELAPAGARVTLRPAGEGDYFWLDFGNLTLMGNVAARDLARVWPAQSEQIERNRQRLLRAISHTAMAFDEVLLAHDVSSLAVADHRLMPLAQALGLPLVSVQEADLVLASRPVKGRDRGVWQPDPMLRQVEQPLEVWLTQYQQSLSSQLAPVAK